MKKIIAVSLLTLMLAVTLGSVASAQGVAPLPTGKEGIPTGLTTAAEFVTLLEDLTDWLFVILVVVSVIFIVLAGFQFITGGGDPVAISAARTKLIWAAVGIGIALLARGLPPAIENLIRG